MKLIALNEMVGITKKYKRILILIMVGFSLLSCKKQPSQPNTSIKANINKSQEQVLSPLIVDILENYILKYPIPKDENDYYFQISFDNNFFNLMRISYPAPEELKTELKGMFYYKDNVIVSIIDNKDENNSIYYNSDFFIKDLRGELFPEDRDYIFDESFPPIWKYGIKNNKTVLIEIDTIWKDWR